LFEDAVERALPDVRAIMVTLRNDGSAIIFSIELEAPRSLTPSDWNYIKATELNGYITSELSETTGYITFTMAREV